MNSYIDEFVESIRKHEQKTIIYGAGMLGKNFRFFLQEECGISIDYFCDKNFQLWGAVIENDVKCISMDELCSEHGNCSVLIAVGLKYLDEVVRLMEVNQIKSHITWLEIIKNNWLKEKFCRVDRIHDINSGYKAGQFVKECKRSKQEHKRIAFFTFIVQGYDELHQPLVINENVDYFVISDKKAEDLGVYEWIDVKQVVPDRIKDPFMQNRYCKMHGADIFKKYDYSIYFDGSCQIVGDITEYLGQVGKTGIALYVNETCTCIYETGILITLVGRCDFELARRQLHTYAVDGMPANYGLSCGGHIFRDHRNDLGNRLMNLWWKEYRKWPTRDQLCLSYVMWKMGLEFNDIGEINNGQNRLEDENIKYYPHCYMSIYSPSDRKEN